MSFISVQMSLQLYTEYVGFYSVLHIDSAGPVLRILRMESLPAGINRLFRGVYRLFIGINGLTHGIAPRRDHHRLGAVKLIRLFGRGAERVVVHEGAVVELEDFVSATVAVQTGPVSVRVVPQGSDQHLALGAVLVRKQVIPGGVCVGRGGDCRDQHGMQGHAQTRT